MAIYGDLEQVKAMLRPTDTAAFSSDALARLSLLQSAVSSQIEDRTGCVFGGTSAPITRTIDGASADWTDVLLLPTPIRSVSGIAIVGDAPEAVSAADYVLWNVDRQGNAHAIRRIQNGAWPLANGVDRIEVTGVWSNTEVGGDVPDDVTYVANYLIAEIFKSEQASPAGFTGPDGATVPIRNPWKTELVAGVIRKYGVARQVVSF
jgi:hypothetical protein